VCDEDSLHVVLVFLGDIFRQKGYTVRQIRRALCRPLKVAQPDENPDAVVSLLYIGSIFNRIGNKITGRESQGACCQDELIRAKSPVVK
jgi:hypothetical protein